MGIDICRNDPGLGFNGEKIEYNPLFNTWVLLPAWVIYFFEALDKKNNYYQGRITFKQSFLSGIVLSAMVTVLGVLTTIISTWVIAPDLFANSIQYVTENNAMTEVQALQQFNLGAYIIAGVIGAPVTGLIFSLIVSLVVPRLGRK